MLPHLLERSIKTQILLVYGLANLLLMGAATGAWVYLPATHAGTFAVLFLPVIYLMASFAVLAAVLVKVFSPLNSLLTYISELANGNLISRPDVPEKYLALVKKFEEASTSTDDQKLIKIMNEFQSTMSGAFRLETGGSEPVLMSGNTRLNGNFPLVDQFSDSHQCVATIFACKRDDFIRITTSLKDTSGNRVVGTALDKGSSAYAAAKSGNSCFGTAQLFGNLYETYYLPVKDDKLNVIGCMFVGVRQKEVQSKNEIVNIVKGLNRLKCSMVTSIRCISKTSSLISSNFTQLFEQAKNSDQQMRVQLENTVSVAGRMDDLIMHSNTVSDYSDTATKTAESANSEVLGIKHTLTVVLQSVEKLAEQISFATQEMDAFIEETHNVESVLKVIKGLAEQTNLLALNAAIEAARAGDQGRGFAVVADEVRSLANRSKESAEEIDKLLEIFKTKATGANAFLANGDKQASQSVEQAENAVGVALEAIMTSVKSINEINSKIDVAVREQNELGNTINVSLNNISESATVAAKDSEQTLAAAMQLSASAQELNGLVSRFRI